MEHIPVRVLHGKIRLIRMQNYETMRIKQEIAGVFLLFYTVRLTLPEGLSNMAAAAKSTIA